MSDECPQHLKVRLLEIMLQPRGREAALSALAGQEGKKIATAYRWREALKKELLAYLEHQTSEEASAHPLPPETVPASPGELLGRIKRQEELRFLKEDLELALAEEDDETATELLVKILALDPSYEPPAGRDSK